MKGERWQEELPFCVSLVAGFVDAFLRGIAVQRDKGSFEHAERCLGKLRAAAEVDFVYAKCFLRRMG